MTNQKRIWAGSIRSELAELLESVLEADCEYVRRVAARWEYDQKEMEAAFAKAEHERIATLEVIDDLATLLGKMRAVLYLHELKRIQETRLLLASLKEKPAEVVPQPPPHDPTLDPNLTFTANDEAALEDAASDNKPF